MQESILLVWVLILILKENFRLLLEIQQMRVLIALSQWELVLIRLEAILCLLVITRMLQLQQVLHLATIRFQVVTLQLQWDIIPMLLDMPLPHFGPAKTAPSDRPPGCQGSA